MSIATLKLSLLGVSAIGIGLGARIAARPLGWMDLPERVEPARTTVAAVSRMAAESLVAVAVARDPFRVTRRPAAVRYDPTRVGEPAPRLPKPVLHLSGILWDGGREPTGLVEGLPGLEGARPVRTGDMVGGVRVKRITRDSMILVGLDTTWTLRVREPWR